MIHPTARAGAWSIIRRFLLVLAAGNLVWEISHLPLYTVWQTGSWAELVYDVLHCTIGDIMIAVSALAVAVAAFGRSGWPVRGYKAVALATILGAVNYTIFSEWLNVEVRGAWTYGDLMPRLPLIGTGLTPVLQWVLVPAAAFWLARPKV